MKKKGFFGLSLLLGLLILVIWCSIEEDSSVLGSKRLFSESDKIVEAYYYINYTGEPSKYISCNDCYELGEGTIGFDKNLDKLVIWGEPEEVSKHLDEIPDYSSVVSKGEDIQWITIYRGNGIYRVIGEVVESSNDKIVSAYYYINYTGQPSKYISCNDCVELGEGTISFDESLDKLVIWGEPEEVSKHLDEIPDYSSVVSEGEDIQWITIYRGDGIYRVIGEIVEADNGESTTVGSDYNDGENAESKFLLLDDGINEESMDVDAESSEEPIQEEIAEEPKETQQETIFDTVAELIASKVTAEMSVETRGYYEPDDGGAAEYYVSNSNSVAYEKLASGVFANLQYSDSVNIKQLGAKGNGVDDDSSYFIKALSLGVSKVIIPKGKFNLANKSITIPKGVSIIGENADDCVLLNLNLTAPDGLVMSNLTCDGAADRKVLTPGELLRNSVMIVVSPKGAQSVSYSNCIFRNADIASFAFANNEGYFVSDSVSDCVFENIGRVAVYHSSRAERTVYTNNSFRNIGSTSLKNGPVAGIWIGDVTENTRTESDYVEITNNKMVDLFTANDFDKDSIHIINAGFIIVNGKNTVISNNYIENLHGFGADREAVYTKTYKLTVDGNTIINGGCGEGYICNKAQSGDISAVITNNSLSGEYGSGIRSYGPAVISGNTINIEHCKIAIQTTNRTDQSVYYPLEVSGNKVNSGAVGEYYYDGTLVSDYNSGSLIKVYGSLGHTIVSGNEIKPGEEYASYIAILNVRGDIELSNNVVDSFDKKGVCISLYSSADGVVNKKQQIDVVGNTILAMTGQKAINMNLAKQNTIRTIVFKNNDFTFSNTSTKNYVLNMNANGQNSDSLEVSGNSANTDLKKTGIVYSTNKLINNDQEFATFTKR